jgi:hypothetical protein
MDLDAVEPRTLRVPGGQAELLDDGINFMGFQRAVAKGFSGRTSETLPAAAMAEGATGSSPCRNMGSVDAANVLELLEDTTAVGVNGSCDGLPGFNLLLGPDAGDLRVAHARG